MGLKAMQGSKTGGHIPGLPVELRKFILHPGLVTAHISLYEAFLFSSHDISDTLHYVLTPSLLPISLALDSFSIT